MNNVKRFFTQLVYSKDFDDSTFLKLSKIFFKRILADINLIYNSVEFKLQTILEPEDEKDLVLKQNKFPTFSSIIEVLGARQKNKFYPANPSLWVVFVSCFMGILVIIFTSILHSQDFITIIYKQFGVAIVGFVLCLTFWVSLFYKEKVYGYHTDLIRRNIALSFWVFLFTEGLCFMSLFWTFFHSFLAASTHIGQFAPGEGIVNYHLNESLIMHPHWNVFLYTDMSNVKIHNFFDEIANKKTYDHTLAVKLHFNLFDFGQLIDPYGYPALNTALLLISATILNSGHVKLKKGKYLKSIIFLNLTLLFGVVFMCVQFLEIKNSTLQYNDGIFACSFYSLTGLHGIHVILGVFALFLCLINFIKGNYTSKRHDTFKFAVVYWHFVDVVWVLVYLLIYCWSSCLYFSDIVRYSYLGYKDYCFNINIKVFEKYFTEKLINDDLAFISEIINFYVSDFAQKQYKGTKALFKKLALCDKKAMDEITHSFFTNEETRENQWIKIPVKSTIELEEHEYRGRPDGVQPEFVKKDLRESNLYRLCMIECFRKFIINTMASTPNFWPHYQAYEIDRYLDNREQARKIINDLFPSQKHNLNFEDEIMKFIYSKQPKKDINFLIFRYNLYNKMYFAYLNQLDLKHTKFEKSDWENFVKTSLVHDYNIWQIKYLEKINSEKIEEIIFSYWLKVSKETDAFNIFTDKLWVKRYITSDQVLSVFNILDAKNEDRFLAFANYRDKYPMIEEGSINPFLGTSMEPKNDVSDKEGIFLIYNFYYYFEKNEMFDKKRMYNRYLENKKPFIKLDPEGLDLKNITVKTAFIKCYLDGQHQYKFLLEYCKQYETTKALNEAYPFWKKVSSASARENFYKFLFINVRKDSKPHYLEITPEFFKNFKECQNEKSIRLRQKINDIEDKYSRLNTFTAFLRWKEHRSCMFKNFNTKYTNSENYCKNFKENMNFQKEWIPFQKPEEIVQNKLKRMFKEGTIYNDLGCFADDNYSDIEKRRKLCLADIPTYPAPKTLSEGLAREGRRIQAIFELAEQDSTDIITKKYIYSYFIIPRRIQLHNELEAFRFITKEQLEDGEEPYFLRTLYFYAPFITPLIDKHYISLNHDVFFQNKNFFKIDINDDYGLLPEIKKESDIKVLVSKAHNFYFDLILNAVNEKETYFNRLKGLKKNEINIHLTYFELYKIKKYINYSELKNDKALYAVFLNLLHSLAFDYFCNWTISDFSTLKGKIKFFILFILYNININWAFTFAARFTPYFLNSNFKFLWGDLLYTRKPKWALKKINE